MIIKDQNYIYAVSGNDLTTDIISALADKPQTEDGYGARLRVDYIWEVFELPPAPPEPTEDEEEATAEDYEAALGRFGV